MHRPANIVDVEMLPLGGQRWDWILGGLLGLLLVFPPAAFGAVDAWSQLPVLATSGILFLVILLRVLFDREFRLASTWLYAPLAAIVLFTALQAASLPASVVRALAPPSVAIREELLDRSFASAETCISLYPYATADFVRLFLVGTVVFVAAASLIRTVGQFKLLLAVVFGVGCLEALLSLAQIATGTGSIYWTVPVTAGFTTAGTFVNYSNFSQFMNLSIGAGLALLLVRLAEQHRDSSGDRFLHGAVRSYWEQNGLMCIGLAICVLAVLASLSRNGALAMLIAATIVGLILLKRSSLSLRGWVVAAIPAIVLMSLFVYGFDLVYARLATLQEKSTYNLRWEMMRAAYEAWKQYPLWGTGFGTHEVVAPQYETAITAALAGHADNDYAQLLEETGLIGVVLVATFVWGVAVVVARLVLRGHKPSALAAYGILYGLVAAAIQSATDFGQRLPANLILTATLSGLVIALARIEFRHTSAARLHKHSVVPRAWLRRTATIGGIVVLAFVWSRAMRASYAAYLGERWWNAAVALESRIDKEPEAANDEDYTNLLASAEGASKSVPGDVQYAYWLNAYRWEAVSRAAAPEGTTALPAAALPIVQRIADELARVRSLAPTYGPPYALEGQLRLFVLHDPAGAGLIKKGVRLANYDPPTCLVAGELAAHEGQLVEAEKLLARALQLQPAYFPEVVSFCVHDLQNLPLAKSLAGTDHRRLLALAAAVEQSEALSVQATALRAEAEEALRAHAAASDAQPEELAQLAHIEQQRQDFPAAIELYRRALRHEYQRFDWRLQLARSLAAAGQTDEAIHELKIALRLRPRDPAATKLLQDLVTPKNR